MICVGEVDEARRRAADVGGERCPLGRRWG